MGFDAILTDYPDTLRSLVDNEYGSGTTISIQRLRIDSYEQMEA